MVQVVAGRSRKMSADEDQIGCASPIQPARLRVAKESAPDVEARLVALDWQSIAKSLDMDGCDTMRSVLTPPECEELTQMYQSADRFRSRVVMARHGFSSDRMYASSFVATTLVFSLYKAETE